MSAGKNDDRHSAVSIICLSHSAVSNVIRVAETGVVHLVFSIGVFPRVVVAYLSHLNVDVDTRYACGA